MSITIIIIAITVVVSIAAFNNAQVFQKSLMNPFMVFNKGQYWRFITSGFIHGSFIHLGFNMFTFFFFGRVVEQTFGHVLGANGGVIYIIFYLSALVVSDLPVALKNRNQINYNSLGASGAVSAVVFASILYYPLEKIYLFGIIGFPGFILGIFYVLYSYFQGRNMSDNINHDAHLYGAIYGAVFAIIVNPPSVADFIQQVSSYSFF
ncbi:MAG: rhomboid family intramembrane serine protease [Marinoscillum sp.]